MPTWKLKPLPTQPADPYLEWATETSFADLFAGRPQTPPDERWLPVIIELAADQSAWNFGRRQWHHPAQDSSDIVIPDYYANLAEWARPTRYCTAMVKPAFLDELRASESLRRIIRRIEIGLPLKTPHEPRAWSPRKSVRRKGRPVVIGIIDDGLAFANELFRSKPKKTRIEFLWNQDGLPTNPPSGFFDGWELRKDTIDDYLNRCTHAKSVDEDEVYARTRHIDYSRSMHKPVARRGAHGTHVMHLAAGYALKDAPDDRPIVCVQLPVATTADTSGASLAKYALDGLHYIIACADALARTPPVVVNISYGMIAGPHNGTSILEAAIDELIALRSANPGSPLSVVLPAGNSRLARCHAQFTVDGAAVDDADRHRTLPWRLLPDDPTPSFMEIWLPASNPACEVIVTSPTGAASPAIQEGEEWEWVEGAEVLCKVLYLTTAAPGRTRNMIFVAVAPTTALESPRKVAPSGLWSIDVRQKHPGAATLDAWIQRDDTPYGYPRRGRQSRFDDREENYPYWDYAGREVETDSAASYIKRDGTINAIGTGGKSVIVAGMRRKDWKPVKYSAGGPVISPGRGAPIANGPDAMAVSDDSAAHFGVLGSGTRTGSTILMNGTSVAAPQITRWIAGEMAAGRPSDRDAVATLVEGPPPPNVSPAPVPERGGAGRVEFASVVPRERFDK